MNPVKLKPYLQNDRKTPDIGHGRTRALLRALAHDVEILLEESQGLPSGITQKLCRRDVQRAKEVLSV